MKPAFQRRAFWSFAGLFLLAFAGWEAVQIARGGRTDFAHLPRLQPLQSRSGERPLLVRETPTGDPIANYLARAKRGMTEQEVRWMLEDFEAQGLDRSEDQLPDFASAKAHRKKLEAWYLTALGEGLGLTAAQMEEAKEKLDLLFAHDLQDLERLKKSAVETQARSPGTICSEELSAAHGRFYEFPVTTYFDLSFAPWNLAQLSDDQTALTLRFWRLKTKEPDPFDSHESDLSRLSFLAGLPTVQDPLTGNLIDIHYFGEIPIQGTKDGQLVPAYLPCSNVLPLTPDQMSVAAKFGDLAAQSLSCHPAQLRLALLQQPYLAQILREQLDRSQSQRGIENSPQASSTASE